MRDRLKKYLATRRRLLNENKALASALVRQITIRLEVEDRHTATIADNHGLAHDLMVSNARLAEEIETNQVLRDEIARLVDIALDEPVPFSLTQPIPILGPTLTVVPEQRTPGTAS